MPYKDPEKRREAQKESNRRWRENFKARDPEGFREYTKAAQKKNREGRTPEKRAEINRKRREWMIRTGRLDPNRPRAPRTAEVRVPRQTHAETIALFAADLSDKRHGTPNGYVNLKCRCDRCREAHAIAHHAYMVRRRARETR